MAGKCRGREGRGLGTGAKKRVISGMRPTGRLHIGHYFGALENWVRLQNDPGYDCFYFIADWHALTSDYADTSAIAQNVLEITTDYLAAGLDPTKSTIFLQSLVPEHAELHLLLSMVTPLGWLERVPTYKEALENIKDKDLHTYGFLGYPALQTADIVMYSEPGTPLIVPVGEDQVSHVELSREIVRRFNYYFGEVVLTERLMSWENARLRSSYSASCSRSFLCQQSFGKKTRIEWRRKCIDFVAGAELLATRKCFLGSTPTFLILSWRLRCLLNPP